MTVTQDDYWSQVSTSMIDKIIETTTHHHHHTTPSFNNHHHHNRRHHHNKFKQQQVPVQQQQQKYQILEELGRGSYGCLFLGQSLLDNSYVAIKVLCKTGLDHQQLELQQLEIDIQLGLKHTHLLTLHGTTQDKDYIYMVMELCDQGDLFDFVVRNNNNNNTKEDEDTEAEQEMVVQTFSQILEAMDYMHQQGVYHRDLKLENILLKTSEIDDNLIECKVADFGLATRERYNMEFGCGSTSYLAPEHFENEDQQDNEQALVYDAAASDIWSLGILLLALLFGRNPWEEATWMDMAYREFQRDPMVLKDQLFPTLSTDCYRFLKSVLSINPADRPSITEMKHQFKALDRLVISPMDQYSQSSDLEDIVLVDDYNNSQATVTSTTTATTTGITTMGMVDDYRWPMDIPTTTTTTTSVSAAAAVAAGKKSDKVSFDSAIFSGTYRAGSTGESWSDMVEEEEEEDDEDVFGSSEDVMSSSTLSSYSTSSCSMDDDTDMFIHTQEKGSWWL